MNQVPKELQNKVFCTDCVEGMRELPAECIPLTVTSPPYDKLRKFGGQRFDFEAIARELWRITKPGGVVIWMVQDAIVKGSETGTSSRQKLFFMDLGFRIHHNMVFEPSGQRSAANVRYGVSLQHIFVLSKGKPNYINLLKDRRNRTAGQWARYTERTADGELRRQRCRRTRTWGVRGPIWRYSVGGHHTTKDKCALKHPALMPEGLAEDLIISFSHPGALVLDPMAGAGTTPNMALLNNRRFLGFEIHEPYYRLAQKRLSLAQQEHRRRLDQTLGVEKTNEEDKPSDKRTAKKDGDGTQLDDERKDDGKTDLEAS